MRFLIAIIFLVAPQLSSAAMMEVNVGDSYVICEPVSYGHANAYAFQTALNNRIHQQKTVEIDLGGVALARIVKPYSVSAPAYVQPHGAMNPPSICLTITKQ